MAQLTIQKSPRNAKTSPETVVLPLFLAQVALSLVLALCDTFIFISVPSFSLLLVYVLYRMSLLSGDQTRHSRGASISNNNKRVQPFAHSGKPESVCLPNLLPSVT